MSTIPAAIRKSWRRSVADEKAATAGQREQESRCWLRLALVLAIRPDILPYPRRA